jgi:hypothetical protein
MGTWSQLERDLDTFSVTEHGQGGLRKLARFGIPSHGRSLTSCKSSANQQ